jgi:hypothetical protein
MNASDTIAIVVGSFENEFQAQQAVKALQRAGFRDDQMSFASKQRTVPAEILDMLLGLGLSKSEADHHGSALNSGRTLVIVDAESRYRAAQLILERNGSRVPWEQEVIPEDAGPLLVGMPLRISPERN